MIDQNASSLLAKFYGLADNVIYLSHFDMDNLKDLFVCWRGKQTVLDYAHKDLLPEHEGEKKEKYVQFSKEMLLANKHTDTTIFVATPAINAQWMIFDGIHRAIGIQRAMDSNPEVRDKTNLRILLLVGQSISTDEDYRLSVK